MYNHYQYNNNNNYHNDSCSMLFCTPNNGGGTYYGVEEDMGSFATTSSVDCTLSLATPSTRSMGENAKDKKQSSLLSSFWNLVPSRNTMPTQTAAGRSHRGASNGGDPLFARRCANCDTTSTPLWRNGPRGPKSLCNACGIRFKKEQRRATAAAAADVGQNQRMGCYPSSEYRFMEDDDHRPEADSGGIPFLSWRFNVTDRPSFVHDFTR